LVQYVEKKAIRALPRKSGARVPVMTMTSVVADFPIPHFSVVSHLGCPARAKPELLVVSSVAMAAIEYEVGILCTTRCVIGVSKWTLTGLDIGSRKKTTFVTGLFLSNKNTIGPAIDLLALVLREDSRDRW